MGRRSRKSNMNIFISFIELIIKLLIYIIIFVFKILTFFITMIIFYCSDYRKKSGNGFFRTYFNKGNMGEYKLYKKISKQFGKENVLTNIYLPSNKIDNTELDVVAVKNGVIYCFEMKNYRGYIYGDYNKKYWTQVINYNTKNKFYNPLRQNYAHLQALKEYLSISDDDVKCIVVFNNLANLSNVDFGNSTLMKLKDINYHFEEIQDDITLNVDKIYVDKLSQRSLTNEKVKKEHIEQIEKLKNVECSE